MSLHSSSTGSDDEVLDVVGVGFGPSNLSVAIALAEHNATAVTPLSARFLERQEAFGWHRGMLIEDTTMQVSFLKDLVTLRNPTSPYSFLSYLHSNNRLVDFINYGSVFPTRLEFHDYLEWAAAGFGDQVEYGTEVTSLRPVRGADGAIEHIAVEVRRSDGGTRRLLTRNVVLAAGLTGRVPNGVTIGERIWHSHALLNRMPELKGVTLDRVTVVGAGQSAAEVVEYFHRTFPEAEVCSVFTRYGYSPADDSSFANRIFDPGAVHDFYSAPEEVKARIMEYHANTNYSVVDPELIDELYRRHYHERVAGKERLRFLNVTRVSEVVADGDRVEVEVESLIDGATESLPSDLVVFATGYRPRDPVPLLGELASVCERDEAGRLEIQRDYRVATGSGLRARIYIQGATEHSHGITSTLLSNVSVRSGEIVQSIAQGVAAAGSGSAPNRPASANPAGSDGPAPPAARRSAPQAPTQVPATQPVRPQAPPPMPSSAAS